LSINRKPRKISDRIPGDYRRRKNRDSGTVKTRLLWKGTGIRVETKNKSKARTPSDDVGAPKTG